MLYTYSVMPLFEDHFEERVADIIDQHRRNISLMPLFISIIQPEGIPAWTKGERIARIYRRYKEALDKEGVPSGILFQSTFGHGTASMSRAPFQFMETLDGRDLFAYCPMDEAFLDHLCREIKLVAAEHPSTLMLDDDVRILMRPGFCCGCPAHMAEYNRRMGTNFTKETLNEYMLSHDQNDTLVQGFVTLMRDTLVHAVTRMREAVDSVDPTIQGVNCTCGDECEAVIYTNPIWCGKGNPTIVRTPNGTYAPITVKTISDTMRRAAVCSARMKENGINYLEIRGVDGVNISKIDCDKAREVRKKLDDAGLKVWSLGSPYGKQKITESFDEHLDLFKHGLELSHILGAEKIRMFSFFISDGEYDKYRDEVMERLQKFIDAAKGSGIALCHENEKGIYGDIASRCLEIHKNFPTLQGVFDPANYVQCGQDTIEAWEMLNPYIEYMHIKDALPDGLVVPPGKGVGNLKYLLENYKGKVLSIEPHLTKFVGFDALEGGEKTQLGFSYPNNRAAFDAAVAALKELI